MTRRKKNGTEKCSVEGCTTPFYGVRYQQNYGGYLCNKHRIQFERHNKIYERTIYDKNKIFINKELNCAEMELYDRYGNVIATTLFDIEKVLVNICVGMRIPHNYEHRNISLCMLRQHTY